MRSKHFFFLVFFLGLFNTATTSCQTSDTKDIQIAKRKLRVGQDTSLYVTSITDTITSASTHRQMPTARAVYEYGMTDNEISDFISTGLGNSPAATASDNDGETWRNITTGELWRSDGSNWVLNLSGTGNKGDITVTSALVYEINNNSVDGTDLALGSDAQGDVMYYNGTDWVRLPAGTSGQFLQTAGAAANPLWANASAAADNWGIQIVEHDATLSGTGVTGNLLGLTDNAVTNVKMADNAIGSSEMADNAINTAEIVDGAVANADLANMVTQTFKGRTTAGTGAPEDLTIAQSKIMLGLTGTNSGDQTITLTGDVTGSGPGSFAATVADNSVDGTDLALGSDAQGDVMYYNGTDWVRLPAGTSGQFLQTAGAAANPLWANASAAADNWGTQVVEHDATLSGTGVTGNLLGLADNAVTNVKMADNAIGNSEMADNAINTTEIVNSAVTNAKIADVSVAKLTSGTLPVLLTMTMPNNGEFGVKYNTGGVSGLYIDDLSSTASIFSEDGTQFISTSNTNTLIGSGTTYMEYIDGVLRLNDSDVTQYIGIKPPATGSLTTSYTMTLPPDDGNNGEVWTTDGAGGITWAAAGGSPTEITDYAASGTFTVPAGCVSIDVVCVGAGGGGGSGQKAAAAVATSGGGGGSSGAVSVGHYSISVLGNPASITVTVGAAGAGGASIAANSTNGNPGTAGGESSCTVSGSKFIVAQGGNFGAGGATAGPGFAQPTTDGDFHGNIGGGSDPATGGGAGGAALGGKTAGSGGGGGTITAANAATAAGAGSSGYFRQKAGGAAGAVGANGAVGTAHSIDQYTGGGGGGGGGKTAAGGTAGIGGAGARGGGGGGGGAARNSTNDSGAGGAGGAGWVRIIAYF